MMENVLWISIALMLISCIISEKYKIRKIIGSIGWGIFSIHWAHHTIEFAAEYDINAILAATFVIFCLNISYTIMKEYLTNKSYVHKSLEVTKMTTSIVAVSSLFYFPFEKIDLLYTGLITIVTKHTIDLLELLNTTVTPNIWYLITVNDLTVRIILGCTGIEGIALFMGLITAVKIPPKRFLIAFLSSIPVIYALNLVRNVFIILAFEGQWFGYHSFWIAHDFLGKIGSGIALFLIAFIVLNIIPELLDLVQGLWNLNINQINNIKLKFKGR
jgi:archaeosortase A (PGF-CTERM-specific)